MESMFDTVASSHRVTTPMPPDREALVEVLINADTVVVSIEAVIADCERLKDSSDAAICSLPDFGDVGHRVLLTGTAFRRPTTATLNRVVAVPPALRE